MRQAINTKRNILRGEGPGVTPGCPHWAMGGVESVSVASVASATLSYLSILYDTTQKLLLK